jgi:hypothetical protein
MHAYALLQPCSPYIESHRVAPTPPTCQNSPTPQLPHSPTLSLACPFLRVSRFLAIELSYSRLPNSLTHLHCHRPAQSFWYPFEAHTRAFLLPNSHSPTPSHCKSTTLSASHSPTLQLSHSPRHTLPIEPIYKMEAFPQPEPVPFPRNSPTSTKAQATNPAHQSINHTSCLQSHSTSTPSPSSWP